MSESDGSNVDQVEDATFESVARSRPCSKNIVICCDGTNNDVTANSTNVLRLFRSLVRDEMQLAFYDSGVGTLADPVMFTRLGKRWSRMIDQGVGHSVRENVCTAYRFLARHYQPGDKIFLFGFSRGAYTVRALAGMIKFLGLIRPELKHLDRLAWAVYSDDYKLWGKNRFHYGNRFKSAFSLDSAIPIHFIGVWDTVSSFGSPWNPRTVPDTANNSSLMNIRHAVSIDEHRGCFASNLFYPEDPSKLASFKQIWFAGSHADVGGGFLEDEAGLSKIALDWMYHEAEACGCLIDPVKKRRFLEPTTGHSNTSRPDPLAPAHVSANTWQLVYKLLEFMPYRRWDSKVKKFVWCSPNMFRHRVIPEDSVLHPSVETKLQFDPGYRPMNFPKSYTYGR